MHMMICFRAKRWDNSQRLCRSHVLIHIHVSAAYSWLQIYLGWQYHFDCICGRRNEEVTRHPKTREQKYHPAIVQPETRIYVSNIWYIFKKNIVLLLSRPRWFNSPTALAYCTIDLMKIATFLSLKHNAKVKNPVCGLIRSCRTRLIIFLPELHSASHESRLPECESHELRLPGCECHESRLPGC